MMEHFHDFFISFARFSSVFHQISSDFTFVSAHVSMFRAP